MEGFKEPRIRGIYLKHLQTGDLPAMQRIKEAVKVHNGKYVVNGEMGKQIIRQMAVFDTNTFFVAYDPQLKQLKQHLNVKMIMNQPMGIEMAKFCSKHKKDVDADVKITIEEVKASKKMPPVFTAPALNSFNNV